MADVPMLHGVLKVASRCNLSCTYCYVYNKGDDSWRGRPAFMSDETLTRALGALARHCEASGQRALRVTFHGGEPLLVGPERMERWLTQARRALGGLVELDLCVQTNATLLDDRWARLFADHGVDVGVSLDGSRELHDRHRVDHGGRGSYDKVLRGMAALREAGLPLQLLCVLPLGADGRALHASLLEHRPRSVSYLLPDYTHDTIGAVRRRYGPTPAADVLLPVLEDWWAGGTMDVQLPLFWHMARHVLGGPSQVDFLGNSPCPFLFVETDGTIEALDVLAVCPGGQAATGLNVADHELVDVLAVSPLHRQLVADGLPLPAGCAACPERRTCGGGYVPHRFSRAAGFDNPSVWCADLLALFTRLRELLDVAPEETALRRQVLLEPVGA